jgi:hypothetical protein
MKGPTDILPRIRPLQSRSSGPLGKGMTWADDEEEKDQTHDNRAYEIEQKVAGL